MPRVERRVTVITLTEAITEVAFGHRMALEAVNEREMAIEAKWQADFIMRKKAAKRAAANVGYDLAYFEANPAYFDARPNPLLCPISIPKEVAALFAAGVQRTAEICAEDGAIASATSAIIEGARAGHFDVWGHFDGREGLSRYQPLHCEICGHIGRTARLPLWSKHGCEMDVGLVPVDPV